MAKGGITTEQHLEKLGAKLTPEQKAQAESLAATSPNVVKYAFRLMGQVTLSKRDRETYDELVTSVGEEAANVWRTARLAAKSAS